MEDRIKIDVYGQLYSIPREIIENGPASRLKRMYKTGSSVSKSECIFINRSPESFAAVLRFYQTGELHIPMTSCPGAFIKELEYWEITPDAVSDCCYNRLQSFIDEQDTLRQFKQNTENNGWTESPSDSYNCMKNIRAKLWEIVDYTKPSLAGKIYFGLTLLMILLSIFTLAYSTDPGFQRAMTNCERLEYMKSSDMEGYEMMKPYLEEMCDTEFLPSNSVNEMSNETVPESFSLQADNETDESDFKVYVFKIMHQTFYVDQTPGFVDDQSFIRPPTFYETVDENETVIPGSDIVDDLNGTFTFRFLRMSPFALDVPIPQMFMELKNVKVPDMKAKLFILIIMESVSNVFFTVDTILRLYSCPRIMFYFMSIINFADGTALIGAYLHLILYYKYPHLRYGNSWIESLAYIQMLRSLRLFRIVANIRAGKVLAYSARKNVKDLSILILFLIAGMCTFASCFYIVEEKTTIESIPDAWYWAIITMTTVGYGDIEPRTKIGRLLACICAVVGVLLLALTVPIFANHFLILYQHVETENVVQRLEKKSTKVTINQKIGNTEKRKAFFIV